jgi:hypothetical protein
LSEKTRFVTLGGSWWISADKRGKLCLLKSLMVPGWTG